MPGTGFRSSCRAALFVLCTCTKFYSFFQDQDICASRKAATLSRADDVTRSASRSNALTGRSSTSLGPASMNVSMPWPRMLLDRFRQRTVDVSCAPFPRGWRPTDEERLGPDFAPTGSRARRMGSRRAFAERPGDALHGRRWEATLTARRYDACFAPCLGRQGECGLRGRIVARNDELAVAVVICQVERLARRAVCGGAKWSRTVAASSRRTAAIAPGVCSPSCCISGPRSRTTAHRRRR